VHDADMLLSFFIGITSAAAFADLGFHYVRGILASFERNSMPKPTVIRCAVPD
jgi:hypothetical protein